MSHPLARCDAMFGRSRVRRSDVATTTKNNRGAAQSDSEVSVSIHDPVSSLLVCANIACLRPLPQTITLGKGVHAVQNFCEAPAVHLVPGAATAGVM
ncbi:hypothetical protein CYMTET_39916 [Cymbomonas tetramitiformis]|uniref:Uncharacterized protein n=1 Tax=Cymbomonas tetramitiformis TaxID=36881 RepID=A0AAE0F423_9CHLO|nr:hypothetical protein CYMTET_39916 [Cymbomonas tetramitiformis]